MHYGERGVRGALLKGEISKHEIVMAMGEFKLGIRLEYCLTVPSGGPIM